LKDKEYRLRGLSGGQIYHEEEMNNRLHQYEEFKEGSPRLQLEQGRPTKVTEIAICVIMYRKDDDLRQHYFSNDITVKEAKQLMC